MEGTREELGSREEASAYELSWRVRIAWIEDGIIPSKANPAVSGRTLEQNLSDAVKLVVEFIVGLGRRKAG